MEQANHSDFSITKYIDSGHRRLAEDVLERQEIGKGTFTAYRADGDNKPVST